jgi:hypothetical protein
MEVLGDTAETATGRQIESTPDSSILNTDTYATNTVQVAYEQLTALRLPANRSLDRTEPLIHARVVHDPPWRRLTSFDGMHATY